MLSDCMLLSHYRIKFANLVKVVISVLSKYLSAFILEKCAPGIKEFHDR